MAKSLLRNQFIAFCVFVCVAGTQCTKDQTKLELEAQGARRDNLSTAVQSWQPRVITSLEGTIIPAQTAKLFLVMQHISIAKSLDQSVTVIPEDAFHWNRNIVEVICGPNVEEVEEGELIILANSVRIILMEK